jgi:hypothetical protein
VMQIPLQTQQQLARLVAMPPQQQSADQPTGAGAQQARPQLSGGGAPVARAIHASHRAAAAGPAGGGARTLPGPRRQLPLLPPLQRTN